ncbi:MAG: hypothetical protein ACYSOF_08905 [Planctomycetota bacterium]|jgi:hypothetical protein
MAKKAMSPSSDVYTAILALACLAVAASAVFIALTCVNYYGADALLKIAQSP